MNDYLYLKEEFPKFQGRGLRGEVLQAYYEAERILKGLDKINKRTCGCNYGAMGREVDRLYTQWQKENE